MLSALWKHLFPEPAPLQAGTRIIQVADRSVLVASFGGFYGRGCAGADAVAQMKRVVHQAFGQHPGLSGLIMDFSALDYVWGDDLLSPLDYHPDWDAEAASSDEDMDDGVSVLQRLQNATVSRRPFPVVYVISDLNRKGLTSLITEETFAFEPKDVLFESVAAATAHVVHCFE